MHEIEIKKSRLVFVYFCILALFAIIILRMIFVVISGDKVKISGLYDPNNNGRRADIYDRNGVMIATDLKTKSLYINSALIKKPEDIARGLSHIFPDINNKEILKKIAAGRKQKDWILLRRNLTPMQVNAVIDLHIAGLIFQDDRARIYLQKSTTSPIVGYTDLDRRGLAGVEMQYDRNLRNADNNLNLALDIRIQDILHNELLSGMESFKAKGAAGIVMDVNTGEVLALASLPSLDPNLQQEANRDQRFNRITTGAYELGSVFKIFTNAIAFEENLVKMNDVFSVREPIKYGRFTITDDHFFKDELTVGEILAYSSNIGTIKIAEKIGAEKQKDFFNRAGLLKKVEVEFPGLGRPLFPKIWREINLFTISYGHGMAVTPLHLAMATAAVVNGGILYQPSFVKLDEQPNGKRIISEKTSKIMRQMLRKVVAEGTGRNANVDGYDVGGKTGTAEMVESGGYNQRQTISSFIAAFPIAEPRYLVYVLFDRSNSAFNTGGMVAAPVAGKVIRGIAPLLGVYPNDVAEDVSAEKNAEIVKEMGD